jgi:DNA-binding transcriptional LysR family regulator
MDFSELSAFIAVAESGSFSLAAEALHLTQPAVSKRVAVLEDELGTALFDRSGRGVRLTRAGEVLLPRARRLLQELADSRLAVVNLAGTVGGRLSIGTSHHIGLHRLPPVLKTFRRRYPDVELDIHFQSSEAACQAVARRDLELAVVTLPETASPPLRLKPIWDDPLTVVVAEDDPLAGRRRVEPETLAGHPAIFPSADTATRALIDECLIELGLRPRVLMETNFLETIKMMVGVGLGWSILPETMALDTVAALHIDGLRISRRLGIASHAKRDLSNAARALIEVLGEFAAARH